MHLRPASFVLNGYRVYLSSLKPDVSISILTVDIPKTFLKLACCRYLRNSFLTRRFCSLKNPKLSYIELLGSHYFYTLEIKLFRIKVTYIYRSLYK